MTSSTIKLNREEILDFLSTKITPADAVIFEKKHNKEAFLRLLTAKQASLLLERMSQVGKDSEYMFAYDVISGLKNDINLITQKFNEKKVNSNIE